jgi:iron-sulfur cluster assembly protein
MMEISKAAIAEITRMQTVRAQPTSNFRIGFASGGCKDFYYTIDLVESTADSSGVQAVSGITISIDPHQLNYLNNLKLDYSEDLMGGGFRFQNPLATSVCGCGNSFSMLNVENVASGSERWQLPT